MRRRITKCRAAGHGAKHLGEEVQQRGDQRDQDHAEEFGCPATRLRQQDFRGCGAAEIPGSNLTSSGAGPAGACVGW
jgi:hypothetical protein